MPTLSPPFFPSFGSWPLEDHPIIMPEENSFYRDTSIENSDSLLPSPPSQLGHGESNFFGAIEGDTGLVKKLNHNASERARRKKINNLYSSLFSLLPPTDRTKKLSIPATVSCVVNYIPELQKELETLEQKKEELSSRMSRQKEAEGVVHGHLQKRRKVTINGSYLSVVTINPVGAQEVVIQISASKNNDGLLSEALQNLEEDGLVLLNASSFLSIGQKVFHNLHFQVQGNCRVELDIIRSKILSLYQKIE